MSHELRTPLNAVLGYSQLLAMGVLGPLTIAQSEQLQRLESSAQHLLRLVNDVLDVARADASQLQLPMELLLTSAATSSAIALVQPQATARGIRLLDLHAGSGIAYVGDEHRVRQILVNLLSNAVKFTAPGGMVTLDFSRADAQTPDAPSHRHSVESGRTWTCISVHDTGVGIPPNLIDRLFEPFVQGAPQTETVAGGTGLGLAISRRLARLMGGDITVRSTHGHGSAFTLWLPSPDDDRRVANVTPPHGTPAWRTPKRRASDSPTSLLGDGEYPIVHALGARLSATTETVAERYVEAIRADGGFPGASTLTSSQLRDHITPVIGLFAAQLMIVGETRGEIPDLLRDGGKVQKYMAELHGEQRLRLGWSEEHIRRESELLIAEVERELRGAVEESPARRSLFDRDVADHAPAAVLAATAFAVTLSRQIIEQSTRASLRSFRQARINTPE
jgi:hypothetical protein